MVKSVTESKRFWVALSMFIFVLCNVPIWWNTTGAYQTNLPHDAIAHVSDQYLEKGIDLSTCTLPLKIEIITVGHSLSIETLKLSNEKQTQIKTILQNTNEQTIDDELQALIGLDKPGVYRLIVNNAKQTKLFIGKYRHAWINLPSEQVSNIQQYIALLSNTFALQGNQKYSHVQVKPALDYRLTFSLLNQDPFTSLLEWDFNTIDQQYLQPLIKKLSPLARFHIDSQILHYANLPTKPVLNRKTNNYEIPAGDIQYLLNANDFQFESPAMNESSLNFLLLSPSKNFSPLHILNYGTQSTVKQDSFIIPRWGGVYIYNGKENTTQENNYKALQDVETVVQIFVEQFRILIGLPSSEEKNVRVVPSIHDGIADWELDALIRVRVLHQLTTAIHSLRSLSKLVHKMPNVMVMEDVADLTQRSLDNIQAAMGQCSVGNYQGSLEHAKEAVYASEHAFFHPSMLSLLYFPDSQKLAVYLPLVLPICFTVTMSFLREIRHVREKQRRE